MRVPFPLRLPRFNDPHQVLGVDRDASQAEIDEAYRRLFAYWDPAHNVARGADRRQAAVERAYLKLASSEPDLSGTGRREESRARSRWVAGVTALAAAALAVAGGASLLPSSSPPGAGDAVQPAEIDAPSTFANSRAGGGEPAPARAPDPLPATGLQRVTLQLGDLPSGYRVLQAGSARFEAGSPPARGWDVVYVRGEPFAPGFGMSESIAVVYETIEAATDAEQAQARSESGRGSERRPLPGAGEVWIDTVSGHPGYSLFRVVVRSGRALGIVSLLDTPGQDAIATAEVLARAQRARLALV